MAIQMSKSKKILFLIALFLTTISYAGEMAVMPITYNIYGAFPDQLSAANFIISGPSLIMIGAALIAPWLINRLGRKMVIIISCVTFTIGGLFCAAFVTAPWMICMRVLIGIGEGLIDVVSVSIIAAVFIDEKKRAAWTGYYMAGMSLASVVLSYISGALAVADWTHAFYSFIPMILTTIAVVIFIPNLKEIDQLDQADASDGSLGKKESLGSMFWIFLANYAMATVLLATLAYFPAVFIGENAIGDEAFSGLWNSVWTLVGFVFTMAFGKIFAKLRKATSIPCLIAVVAGTLVMTSFPSKAMALAGSVIIGIGAAVYFAYGYAIVPVIVPASKSNLAVSLTTAVYAGVYFLITYVVTWLMDVMNTNGMVTPVMKAIAIFAIIPLVIEIATQKKFNREFPPEA